MELEMRREPIVKVPRHRIALNDGPIVSSPTLRPPECLRILKVSVHSAKVTAELVDQYCFFFVYPLLSQHTLKLERLSSARVEVSLVRRICFVMRQYAKLRLSPATEVRFTHPS